jgi:hypothetical protein
LQKVCSGSGVSQLRLLLAEHDAIFLGDAKRADSAIAVMSLDAWKRVVRMPTPPR